MPKPDQLPPLAWVRAFCEVDRQGSFKAAAAALNLSPSTISHEIRKLENWVATPLFDRSRRKLALTQEGEELSCVLGPAYAQIEQAFSGFGQADLTEIRIGMFPFAASEFFIPMIASLNKQLPESSIEIAPHNALAALTMADPTQRVDAVIKYAQVLPAGFDGVCLTPITLAVVQGCNKNAERVRRIVINNAYSGWDVLDAENGTQKASGLKPLVVDNYMAAMRAVEQGLGLCIGVLPLCVNWLIDNRVKIADAASVSIEEKYWLIWRRDSPKTELLSQIADTLEHEFSEQRAKTKNFTKVN